MATNIFSGMNASWDPWGQETRRTPLDPGVVAWQAANPRGGVYGGHQYVPTPAQKADPNAGDAGGYSDDWSQPVVGWSRQGVDASGQGLDRDWERYAPDGKYEGSYIGGTQSWLDKYGWLIPAAMTGYGLLAGGTGGASAAAAAAGTNAPLNMAMIESGLGTAGYGYNAGAAASGLFNPATIGAGAGMTLAGGEAIASAVTSAAGPGAWETLTKAASSLGKTVTEILGDNKLLSSVLGTAAAMALSKKAEAADADPALANAINGLNATANAADKRATENDDYWKSTFAPRYLNAMDEQLRSGKELQDFNMGLARKYDQRYWDTTAKYQDKFYQAVDAYDGEGERNRVVGQAGATVDQQNSGAMSQLARQMQRAGVNPNSGVWASNLRQIGQQGGLNKAMAMNMAREASRKEGLNLKAMAAGMGGNLTGASAGYAGQAAGATGIGMRGINDAQNGWGANNAGWNSTMGVGSNARGQVGQWGMGLTNNSNATSIANTTGYNGLLGYGLGKMFGG